MITESGARRRFEEQTPRIFGRGRRDTSLSGSERHSGVWQPAIPMKSLANRGCDVSDNNNGCSLNNVC